MSGIVDLSLLLKDMRPELRDGEYAYCTVPGDDAAAYLHFRPIGVFREEEGLTLILERGIAEANGMAGGAPMRLITLTVHSSLEAVGLTAAIATELTRHGISANVVAAYYHDHVFVPSADAERAVAALAALGGG